MDRRIKEYLSNINLDSFITTPYDNHHGGGCSMGSGDIYGKGRAFVSFERKDDYKASSIISYNNNTIYSINGYSLYITNIHEPWANAEIIKNDLTTQSCYIGKINNHIVIESSIHDAINKLRTKILMSNDNEMDVAKAFVISHPDYEKEYNWDEMVFWHSIITTSCADGRKRFSHNANKNSASKATPKELIGFMKRTSAINLALKMEELYLNNLIG